MNWRLVLHLLGTLSLLAAGCMLPSLGIALFGEATPAIAKHCTVAFVAGIVGATALGLVLRAATRRAADAPIRAAEGFALAAFGWILMAAIGALPLYLCKGAPATLPAEAPVRDAPAADAAGGPARLLGAGASLRATADDAAAHGPGRRGSVEGGQAAADLTVPGPKFTYCDAYFEAMSGFTTTGATVFGTPVAEGGHGRIECLPRSFLFWRSLTHWLGGMGIVVLCLAVLPALRAGGYQMFRAEVPGPTAERLRPRVSQTAAILWGVYLLLSGAETLLLWLGDMPIFDALCHTFGTMATGGFSTKDASIGHYAQAGHPSALYFEIVIDVFMFLAGCNFLLHFKALHGEPRAHGRDSEFRFYALLLGAGILIATVGVRLAGAEPSIGAALRSAVFQVISITTTTGFCTADFDLWPGALRGLMVALMFAGGCAGSTGGGLKQLRILVAWRTVRRELLRLLRPELANRVWIGRTPIEERLLSSIIALVLLWLLVFVVASILVLSCLQGVEAPGGSGRDDAIVTGVTAVAATLNNIGPGLGGVGATRNYGWMPLSAKMLLSLCMLMGRLEIYSVVVLLLPQVWRR